MTTLILIYLIFKHLLDGKRKTQKWENGQKIQAGISEKQNYSWKEIYGKESIVIKEIQFVTIDDVVVDLNHIKWSLVGNRNLLYI